MKRPSSSTIQAVQSMRRTELTLAQRQAFLHRLWFLDGDLWSFVHFAHQLGFAVTSRWDLRTGMPELAWLH